MLTLSNVLAFIVIILLGWLVLWLGKFRTPVEDNYLSPEELEEMIKEELNNGR